MNLELCKQKLKLKNNLKNKNNQEISEKENKLRRKRIRPTEY